MDGEREMSWARIKDVEILDTMVISEEELRPPNELGRRFTPWTRSHHENTLVDPNEQKGMTALKRAHSLYL